MTLPRHYTSNTQQGGGTEAEFVGAEQSGNDHIARELEAAIHAQSNLPTQTSLD